MNGGNKMTFWESKKPFLTSKSFWCSVAVFLCGGLTALGYGDAATGVGLLFTAILGIDIRRKLK